MTVGELNHLMTYVTEGWMLFSLGFIGIEFVSFVSRRIQEDIEADKLALKNVQTDEASVAEAVEGATFQQLSSQPSFQPVGAVVEAPETLIPTPPSEPKAESSAPPAESKDELSEEASSEALTLEDEARLEEVAAVSEQLAKTKSKQSDASSVSVST